ncbi:hypothetical protein GobsT_31380 [Gemmata obscuriglobus]|nr:hypothetical protein GobsT_31380 [Gemmata obscuriglobus]VTS06259.1 Uncharacterized protein OS=Pseudomonas phage PPpW-3 PE=4 SV=1 [Gemmata obscuriglobus UQM 2246]
MDNRAYHLQSQAHSAVAVAIANGTLLRQPCQICGRRGQAHHDSYYPAKWLTVRWLCAKLHRQWHEENEPEWPTTFEFHPSDVTNHCARRPGRPSKPWLRTFNQCWYVKIGGKQINLGRDREAAFRRFQKLCGDAKVHSE